ncbi:MAG: hypothetical protein M2R45_01067 [Verrucomicrobia subdivision 3 bacterium]|nr:hypothetical protein [Limisphaerales bacterium]MCS1414177.1 hypothetical protein [Limisphaerales bacterium]
MLLLSPTSNPDLIAKFPDIGLDVIEGDQLQDVGDLLWALGLRRLLSAVRNNATDELLNCLCTSLG